MKAVAHKSYCFFSAKIPCNSHNTALPSISTIGKGENRMEKELNTINEKLQDALSLLIILENDFQSQHTDEVYQRTIHVIHEQLKSAIQDIEIANANS